ncbi:MAG: hypothetical protein JST55_15060 [Bacteroidetes bacterium]|nr:hypothetical protein [Bacteroidota bacterium]
MKKNILFFFIIIIVFISGQLSAQSVTFKMKRPPLNQLKAADLWSATIINSGEAFTAYLYGSMTNNENGELIATGQTMTFEVKKGTTNFKVSDLPRIPDVNYTAKDEKYKKSFMNTGGAPPGDYKICCELRYTNNTVAGEDCFEQKIMGGDAPQLISPRNDEELKIDNPVFTWMHMKGPGSTSTYKLRIVELKGDESPENAMLKNKAFFEKEGITAQLFQYPASASKFEEGKKYAWQISVGDLKSEVNIFDRWGNGKAPGVTKSLPTFCNDFENNNISNWLTYNNFNGVITTQTSNLVMSTPGSNTPSSNYALNITDVYGSTFIYNPVDFAGDYTQKLGNCLCFDFKLTTNDEGAFVHPRIFLVQNFNTSQPIAWGTNPTLAATFTATATITQNSNWVHVCAPIDLCSNGSLPSNSDGSWQMLNNGTCNDWQTLLSNVSGLMFSVDMSGWGGTEIFDIDNVCITNCSWPPPSGGNVCDSLNAVAVSNAGPVGGDCCWSLNLSQPVNMSNINSVQFLALSPNSFVTGSSHLGSSSGWFTSVNNGQEFTVRKMGTGSIPGGPQNGFFNFCLNKLSSPQHVVVNWKSDSTIVCSDTVTLNCEIPCVTFTKDTVTCNGSNYNLNYSFTNNATYAINKIEVSSVTPSSVTVTPNPLILSTPVNSGATTNLPAFTLTGAIPGTTVCVKFKFTSPDGCCWCYDSLCVVIPSCVCNEVGATLSSSIGDPLNCCYSINLQNNYQANYFNQVMIRTLEPGIYFSTWSTNTANNFYSSNVYPDNVVYLWHDPVNYPNSYIPTGNSANVLNFCLGGNTTTTQHVLVDWMRNDSIKCTDTLTLHCTPLPPPTPCTQFINDTLTCLPNGTYQYTFHVRNNSSHTTTGFQINPVSPSGLTFTPSPANFSNVTLGPGMISPQQSIIISGVTPGSQFCFNISLYEHTLIAGQQWYDWCCYSTEICKTAPSCTPANECKFEVMIDSVKCKQNAAGQWYYNVSTRINNMSGAPATLNSVLVTNGTMNCTPTNLATGMNVLNCAYTFTGAITNPVCFTYRILRPGSADTCKYKICRDLPNCSQPSGCNCGQWLEIWDDNPGHAKITSTDGTYYVDCFDNKNIGTLTAGNQIKFEASYQCNPYTCAAVYDWVLKNTSTSQVILSGTNASMPLTFTPPSGIAANYQFVVTPICGSNKCDPCGFYFRTKVKQDCDCGEWKSKEIQVKINEKEAHPLMCGDELTLDAGSLLKLKFPDFACKPKDCGATYKWDLRREEHSVLSDDGNSFKNEFTEEGMYTLSFKAYCGGKLCDSCFIKIKVTKVSQTGCDCGPKEYGGQILFDTYKINCGVNPANVIFAPGNHTITGPSYVCSTTQNCSPVYTSTLIKDGVQIFTHTGNIFAANFMTNGNANSTYTIKFSVTCGGKECGTCQTSVVVGNNTGIK